MQAKKGNGTGKGELPAGHAAATVANREARVICVTIASSVEEVDTTAEDAEHRVSHFKGSGRETTRGHIRGTGCDHTRNAVPQLCKLQKERGCCAI